MIGKLTVFVILIIMAHSAHAGQGTIRETETEIIIEYSGSEEDEKAAKVREAELDKERNAAQVQEIEQIKKEEKVKIQEEKILEKQLNPTERSLQRRKALSDLKGE